MYFGLQFLCSALVLVYAFVIIFLDNTFKGHWYDDDMINLILFVPLNLFLFFLGYNNPCDKICMLYMNNFQKYQLVYYYTLALVLLCKV